MVDSKAKKSESKTVQGLRYHDLQDELLWDNVKILG